VGRAAVGLGYWEHGMGYGSGLLRLVAEGGGRDSAGEGEARN